MPHFRKLYEVIGYAYDADLHCVDCTKERFPLPNQAVDSEGNEVYPVFLGEEDNENSVCADCHLPLDN